MGSTFTSMTQQLQKLAPPSPAPPPPSSWPLYARYPDLSRLPAEALARLVCAACGGSGVRGPAATPCRPCAGFGLTCPTCHSQRWLMAATADPGRWLLLRCHGCPTPDVRQATITAFIAAQEALLRGES